ncbi:galactosylceramide sulfotransferase-like [Glandiceps talaboti]
MHHVVFIKTHKTASSTTSAIFNRFGLIRNLSFVVNKKNWPSGNINFLSLNADRISTVFLPPRDLAASHTHGNLKYDISAVHARYNRSAFQSFMLSDALYVTILREPAAQFESAFDCFLIYEVVKTISTSPVVDSNDVLAEFLSNPQFYRRQLDNKQWLLSKNSQIYDLGLEHRYHSNETIVTKHIETLKEELDLVMIMEYFDESLILLRRQLNWSFEDIMYIPQNERPWRPQLPPDTVAKILEWNNADRLLYDAFNQSFWQRVKQYGEDFSKDLETFRRKRNNLATNCVQSVDVYNNWHDRPRVIYSSHHESDDCCQLYLMDYNDLQKCIWNAQNSGCNIW